MINILSDITTYLNNASDRLNSLEADNASLTELSTALKAQLDEANNTITILQAALKPPIRLGVNVHFFNSPIYKDVDRVISDALAAGFKFFRCDFFTQSDGSIQQEDFFLTQILPKCHAAGLQIQPMLNTPGLSVNSTDVKDQYNKGYAVGLGFANRYGKYFNQYEIGNELGMIALLAGTDGRKLENYDKNKLTNIASYLKGMNAGIKAGQITATTILNGEWLHVGFIDYCISYGVGFDELSWHWYTNQDGAMATQGWNTGKTLFDDWIATKYPNYKIRFNEVGYYSSATTETGFSQATQTSKLVPLVSRLLGKGFEVCVYELYDQVERLPNLYESSYGVYDANLVAKDVVAKLSL